MLSQTCDTFFSKCTKGGRNRDGLSFIKRNRDSLSFIKKIGEMCREMFCFHAGFCRVDKKQVPEKTGRNDSGRKYEVSGKDNSKSE